jgi:flagellar hook-basal body complex protein FliE
MAAINPTSGIRPPGLAGQIGAISRPQTPADKADFAKMLKTYVDHVDGQQQVSYAALKDFIAGRTQDVVPVVHAVAKADLSFKLLMGVRNKVIEAYKQTMNMQV